MKINFSMCPYGIIQNKNEDEMILVADDKDYVPAIHNISKRGIRVDVWFWDHAAQEIKDAATVFFIESPSDDIAR